MSITTCFRRMMARRIDAVRPFFRNSLLVAGSLLVLGIADAPAQEMPASDIAHSFPALIQQADVATDHAPATAPAATTLSPSMQGALDHVKKRYNVSKDAMRPLFEAVQTIAKERRIDPLLIVAIIAVESRFNPFAEGGSARGLMQIIPRYHMDKLPKGHGKNSLFDPVINVKVGAHVLDDAIRRSGSLIAGLQSYNGSAHKVSYARKVLAERERLEVAGAR